VGDAVRKPFQFADRFAQFPGAFGDGLFQIGRVLLQLLLCARQCLLGLFALADIGALAKEARPPWAVRKFEGVGSGLWDGRHIRFGLLA